MSHTISDVQWHAFMLLEKYRPHISSVKYRLSSITPLFQGTKLISPSPPLLPLIILHNEIKRL